VFRDLAYVLVAAVLGAALARAARQPMVIGFVLAGLVIGPFTPGPSVSDFHSFELFAEIGVVLLMFSIGVEFSLRDLLRVKWVALLGGHLSVVLTVALALLVGTVLGWPPLQSLAVGIVISVSSTMVLARLLVEHGELHSTHGRVMVGIALVEDLVVVALTVLLPALGALEPGRLLTIGEALLRAALIFAPFFYLAAKVVPRVMARVAATQSDELFLLFVLAIGLGTAAITQALGLSTALGAFLAGLLISESDYAHETLARLLPLRDVFVALFFVTVGALIDPPSVLSHLPLLVAIVALIVVGKLIVRTLVVTLFRYPLPTALLVGVGSSQIGEFSFVLVQVARDVGHVGDEVYNATLAASLLTILLNASLMKWSPQVVGRLRLGPDPEQPPEPSMLNRHHVVICGYGRVGSAVGEALETFQIPFTVVERDPELIRELRARGIPCLFGDAGHRELLLHAGVRSATMVVVAMPHIGPTERAVRVARFVNPNVPILARAHERAEAESLQRMGATEVIQPELEASATLIRHVLATLHMPKERTIEYLERFRDAMLMGRDERPPSPTPLPAVHEVALGTGRLADQSLRDARIRERFGVTVVAVVKRDGTIFNPSPETILRSGDGIRVFGLPDQVAAFTAAAKDSRA
jgi:CPA2 family monovalent cation:H+ antiporter-2